MNTVRRWAHSLVANLNNDDEVVIVDGLSTDGSQEFLPEFCKGNEFKFVSAKTNMGEARQLAFKLAEGEYLVFCLDTDDEVVSLQEAKRLYHEVAEWDPITGKQRAFRCRGFFIVPRWMLEAIGGYPDLHYYEDRLLASQLTSRGQLTASSKVSAVARGSDPKKRRLPFRLRYSFQRIRDGLRLGLFDAWNVQGLVLLPLAWLASLRMSHYEYRRDWDKLDTNRDEYILRWIEMEHLSHKLMKQEIEKSPRGGHRELL